MSNERDGYKYPINEKSLPPEALDECLIEADILKYPAVHLVRWHHVEHCSKCQKRIIEKDAKK